ncbi:hypothetical protein Tco_0753415, partial [Tanacetum coccineum]
MEAAKSKHEAMILKANKQIGRSPFTHGIHASPSKKDQVAQNIHIHLTKTKVDPGLSALNDSITSQQGTNEDFRADEISKKIKLEDLSNLLKDTRSAFFTPDSPQDEPIIVLDESEEEEVSKD